MDVKHAVISILQRSGWEHSHLDSSCFDVLGREDDRSVLVKTHTNIDSATRESSAEMKKASVYLSASPLIVGTRNSRGELEQQVIYERYGIPAVKPETLEAYLELQQPSIVMNKKGGYYVSLDTDKVEERRKEEGYSLNALAKEVGVSRKTISNYRERGVASVEKAERLEAVLGDVFDGIDIFDTDVSVQTSPSSSVAKRLAKIGFDASSFKRAPFDAAAKDADDRFVAKEDSDVEQPVIRLLTEISHLADSTPFLIGDRPVDRVGTISQQRFDRLSSKDELKREIAV